MYNIKTYNKISSSGIEVFDKNCYNISDDVENPIAALVRSASLHEVSFDENLIAIARAGAGTNNIPVEKCTQSGIVVFNTPSANANAVKELTVLGLLLASRKVVDGIEWAKGLKGAGCDVPKLVEKGKAAFVGPEIRGKKLGVIGLGAIGVLVANAANELGMTVLGYDPFLSLQNAWNLSHNIFCHAVTGSKKSESTFPSALRLVCSGTLRQSGRRSVFCAGTGRDRRTCR